MKDTTQGGDRLHHCKLITEVVVQNLGDGRHFLVVFVSMLFFGFRLCFFLGLSFFWRIYIPFDLIEVFFLPKTSWIPLSLPTPQRPRAPTELGVGKLVNKKVPQPRSLVAWRCYSSDSSLLFARGLAVLDKSTALLQDTGWTTTSTEKLQKKRMISKSLNIWWGGLSPRDHPSLHLLRRCGRTLWGLYHKQKPRKWQVEKGTKKKLLVKWKGFPARNPRFPGRFSARHGHMTQFHNISHGSHRICRFHEGLLQQFCLGAAGFSSKTVTKPSSKIQGVGGFNVLKQTQRVWLPGGL